jgi:hypothetical protein
MKTKLLQVLEPAYLSEFFDDLRKLFSPDSETLFAAILPWIRSYLASSSRSERDRLVAQVAQSAGADLEVAKSLFTIVTFISRVSISQMASPGDFCEDLQTIARDHNIRPLSDGDITRFHKLLSDLATQSSEFRQAAAISQIARGFLPMYDRVHATVELRSTESPLLVESLAENVPFQLIPIASVRVTLDSGDPSEFFFQITEEEVVELVKKLQELHGTMVKLRENVTISK